MDLAKLSLWLATLAKDHPLTFVDHALRAGDSLVGLSRTQIGAFDWKAGGGGNLFAGKARAALARVQALRRQIREAEEDVPDHERRALWKDAEHELASVRLYGDLMLSAFFGEAKPAARERERRRLAADVLEGRAEDHRSWIKELRAGDPPLAPFHWEIEFPEVFDRDNPGFDAFVGNPPFAGKNTVNAANPPRYLDWLKEDASRKPWELRPRRPFLPTWLPPAAGGGNTRPDRDEHHRAGRHSLHRVALDLRERGERSTTPPGATSGRARRRWWSA